MRSIKSIYVLVLILCSLLQLQAAKTDTIYFQQGNKLTCEVKQLENNLLKVSTSDAGTLEIKWDKIDSLYIKQYIIIEMKDGEYIIGSMAPSDTPGMDKVIVEEGARFVKHLEVVQISPLKKKFLDQLSLDLGTGFSYVKATEQAKFDFSGDVGYRAEKYWFEAQYNALWSSIADTNNSQRHAADLSYYHLFPHKFFSQVMLSAENNSELGLNLRSNVGVGLGNNFIFTNKVIAKAALGIQGNRENTVDSAAYNAEGIVGFTFKAFRHSSPKLDLSVESVLYPNFVDTERVRTSFNSKLRWEIFSDFFINYTFYHTYDSKPLSSSAKKQDWSITTGIEYSF